MPISKIRTTLYFSPIDKKAMKKRASELNKTMSEYVTELVMWDSKLRLIENVRENNAKIETITVMEK